MSTECGENQESETRVRRIRPSRARGLRATTGCLTCRKRRIKCDENKPECNNCDRAERNCTYGRSKSLRKQPPQPATSPPQVQIIDGASVSEVDQELNSNPYHTSDDIKFDTAIRGSIESPVNSNPGEGSSLVSDRDFDLQATHESLVDLVLPTTELDLPISQEPGESLSAPDVSNHVYKPVSDWYDLVAQAAITDFEKSINPTALPWRQSGGLDVQLASVQWVDDTSASYDLLDAYKSPHYDTEVFEPLPLKLWNTENRIVLTSKEVVYFQYYVEVIGPILDLMDLSRQFSNSVPHLATHNFGLSRAIIAVAAQHASLHEKSPLNLVADSAYPSRSLPESLHSDMKHMAAQCYYETLQYLSYHITQPSYCQSPELSATAVLISMYEMFNPSDVTDTSNWERHLRGGFWIQRTQNNNAEMENNIGRATWCSWVRQDIWFAFRENRRTLTLFRPHKPLESLNEEELITRILPMAARCVDFVAEVNESCELNVRCCIERGELLLTELNHWYSLLPDSFHPISTIDIASPNPPLTATSSYQASSTMEMPVGYLDPTTVFTPLWVHPPAYAAAIQMYHFAMIMVLLNQPLTGGRSPYLKRQKLLNKSVDVICGLAASKQGEELPNAWVNSQALFAAGLCVQSQQKKDALLVLLHKSQNIFKVPQKSLAEDLQKIWKYDN